MANINSIEPVNPTQKNVSFRWIYILLPAAVLLIAVVLAIIFYGNLPRETAYRFSDGVPVSWLDRGGVLFWGLGLQLIFMLLSLAITFLVTSAARRMRLAETSLYRALFAIIGNIVALPQIIIAYAMLDIFLYNIYEKSLPPLWVFALAVMFAGGVAMAVIFTRAFVQSQKSKSENIPRSESDVR